MIIKEWAQDEGARDKFAAAGAEAERQLAHYLKRKYGDRKDVLVFNNLRIESENGDDAAQYDHLILHRRGFILIESKSVTSKVKINARGEWLRLASLPHPRPAAYRRECVGNGRSPTLCHLEATGAFVAHYDPTLRPLGTRCDGERRAKCEPPMTTECDKNATNRSRLP